MLLEEFMLPMGLTQQVLADAIHVPYQLVDDIINEQTGITASTALRLAKFFNTSPDFWLNLQLRWDLYHTQRDEQTDLNAIQPYAAPSL